MMIWKVYLQGISNPIQLERDLDNTRGKNRKKSNSKIEGKKLYAKTNKVHPWLKQYSEGLYELLYWISTKKNGSFRVFFHASIMKINFRQYFILSFLYSIKRRSKSMRSFALNTDVSSYSETALNSIVFSSKKHVLTPNIHFSLPHTKYHYYYNKYKSW